jgi:pyridoxine 5-phosphate synthase
MTKLGVNVDHVATLRQARQTVEPDPVTAAAIAELAGADSITVHLREDRRHISDRDVEILRRTVRTRLNLEMAATESILGLAAELRPHQATLVPERREEVTTEGGLDVASEIGALRKAVELLTGSGISVSLFVDPETHQIEAAAKTGAALVELHTGAYAQAETPRAREAELDRLDQARVHAFDLGLTVNAGHGLTYWNVADVARLPAIEELNIGHSIVSRAVLVGLDHAVREMRAAMTTGEAPCRTKGQGTGTPR